MFKIQVYTYFNPFLTQHRNKLILKYTQIRVCVFVLRLKARGVLFHLLQSALCSLNHYIVDASVLISFGALNKLRLTQLDIQLFSYNQI